MELSHVVELKIPDKTPHHPSLNEILFILKRENHNKETRFGLTKKKNMAYSVKLNRITYQEILNDYSLLTAVRISYTWILRSLEKINLNNFGHRGGG